MKETHIILRERALANSSIDAKMAEISELYGDYIEFLLSPNIFAIESSFVKEVFSLKEITPVPGTPQYISGLINIRSRIYSVLNLKPLLAVREKGLTDMNKVLLIENSNSSFGLIADKVIGKKAFLKDDIHEPPANLGEFGGEFIIGVSDTGTILLSAEKILNCRKIIINQ
jgi:purine-binding chemotaxis protein CheW